jgi:hypothetical protein
MLRMLLAIVSGRGGKFFTSRTERESRRRVGVATPTTNVSAVHLVYPSSTYVRALRR